VSSKHLQTIRVFSIFNGTWLLHLLGYVQQWASSMVSSCSILVPVVIVGPQGQDVHIDLIELSDLRVYQSSVRRLDFLEEEIFDWINSPVKDISLGTLTAFNDHYRNDKIIATWYKSGIAYINMSAN